MKIIRADQVDAIIKDYTVNLIPMKTIAIKYGVTRQAIHKLIRKEGVDTSNTKIKVTCCSCGEEIERPRCQVRNRKRIFCSPECYTSFLRARSEYKPWRQGQRIARVKIAEVFPLTDTNVVHHIDGNNWNNTVDNLMVFANQGDHIRFHRGFEATPLWPV